MSTTDIVLVIASGRTYTIDFKARRITSDVGEHIRLTSRQWALCTLFVAHAGSVVSKDRLAEEVWQSPSVEDAAIGMAVRAFRKVFANFDPNEFIATEHGLGYRLTAEVSREIGLVPKAQGEPPPQSEGASESQIRATSPEHDSALKSADDTLRLSIAGDDAKAFEVGLEAINDLAKHAIENSALQSDFIGAFLRLTRRVVRLACGRWNGANPDLAMATLLHLGKDSGLRRETPELRLLNIMIDSMVTLVARRLPYETNYQSAVIRDRNLFTTKLQKHFDEISDVVQSGSVSGILEEEAVYVLISTYLSIRRSHKIIRRSSDALAESPSLKSALAFRIENSQLSFRREIELLRIRLAMLPEKGSVVNLRNLRNSKVILERKLEKNGNDIEWIEAWSKATLLLTYKIRDGEALDQGFTWNEMLDDHEEMLLKISSSCKDSSKLTIARILLRMDRKRREMSADESPFIDEIIEFIVKAIPYLPLAPMHIFGPIINEIQSRPSSSRRQADLFSCLCDLYLKNTLAFRSLRVGKAIELIINRSSRKNHSFYKFVWPALERIQEKSFSNAVVTMAYEWHKCDEMLSQGDQPLKTSHKKLIRKVGVAAASQSRHRIRDYIKFLYSHAVSAKSNGDMPRARSIAHIASSLSERYCVDIVDLTEEIYNFLAENLDHSDQLKSNAVKKIADIKRRGVDVSSVAGSMLFTARTWLASQEQDYQNLGRRLLFEAMVNADTESDELRIKARRFFALNLAKSNLSYHKMLARQQSTPAPSSIPQAAVEAFARSQDRDFRTDYLALLRTAKLPLLPVGSTVPGKLTSIVRDGPLAGVVFSNENIEEPIYVRKQFMSRDLFNSIAAEIPEWSVNVGDVLGDDLPMDEGIPYGQEFLINTIKGSSRVVEASMVGPIFVAKIINQILPKLIKGINANLYLGGSNTYAVLIVDKSDTWWLGNDNGRFHKQMTELMNLRRLLFVPRAESIIQQQINFVEYSFNTMTILDVDEKHISLRIPAEKGLAEASIRTFASMFKKVFPTIELSMPSVAYERLKNGESDELDAFW